MSQTGEVRRGGPSSDHDYLAALKRCKVIMPVAVGQKFSRQAYQRSRYMLEVGNSDGEHYAFRFDDLAIVQPQHEAFGRFLETADELVFKLGNHAFPESKSIGSEGVEAHRNSHVGVLDAALGTKLLKRKSATWIVNVRGKTVRL